MRFFDEGRAGFDSTFEALGYEIWRHQEQTAFFVGDRTTLAIEGFHELVLTDIPPVAAATIRELARELGRSMLRCLTLGRLAGAHAASSATRRRAGHPARARAPGDTPVQFRDVTLAENHTEEDA
jgi:hypothetical protein